MPNWCNNDLTVTGPQPELERFLAMAAGDASQREYAKDRIERQIEARWSDEQKARDAAEKAKIEPLCFERLFPIPPEILAKGYDQGGYDWECAHWGCKWGACNAQRDDLVPEDGENPARVDYRFDTPWGPPFAWLHQVARQFPALAFGLHYEEMGMAFLGEARWERGVLREDTRRSLSYEDPADREELIELGWLDEDDPG